MQKSQTPPEAADGETENPAKAFEKPPLPHSLPFTKRREMEMAKKKHEKAEKERAARMADFRKRGIPEDQLDMVMAQDDYQRMSPNERLHRLEAMVAQGFQGMANEMQALRHNDFEIATSMDINLKAIGKALTKLGIPPEEQMLIIQEAQAEIAADDAARKAAREAQRAAADEQKAAENAAVAEVVEKREVMTDIDKPGTPDEPTEGEATVYGG